MGRTDLTRVDVVGRGKVQGGGRALYHKKSFDSDPLFLSSHHFYSLDFQNAKWL